MKNFTRRMLPTALALLALPGCNHDQRKSDSGSSPSVSESSSRPLSPDLRLPINQANIGLKKYDPNTAYVIVARSKEPMFYSNDRANPHAVEAVVALGGDNITVFSQNSSSYPYHQILKTEEYGVEVLIESEQEPVVVKVDLQKGANGRQVDWPSVNSNLRSAFTSVEGSNTDDDIDQKIKGIESKLGNRVCFTNFSDGSARPSCQRLVAGGPCPSPAQETRAHRDQQRRR